MDTIRRLQDEAAAFATEPLLVTPGGYGMSLHRGYIPLLTNFTFEDKAAKGFRKRTAEDRPEPAVYFSALELVRDNKILLLSGPSGSGKTSFAKYLSYQLSFKGTFEPRALIRNEDGAVYSEKWAARGMLPCYFGVEGPETLKDIINNVLPKLVDRLDSPPGLILVLDMIENAGDDGFLFIAEIIAFAKKCENMKLLLLGETSGIKDRVFSSDVVRHDLLPLLQVQRRQNVSEMTGVGSSDVSIGLGQAAANPVYFALALEAKHHGDSVEDLLDAWLSCITPEKDDSDKIVAEAFDIFSTKSLQGKILDVAQANDHMLLSSTAIRNLLVARHLLNLPKEIATALFYKNPTKSEPILQSLLRRLSTTSPASSFALASELMKGSQSNAQLGALLVSDFVTSGEISKQIAAHMLAIIQETTLPFSQREKASRVLSRSGDPRDLTALAAIPSGEVTLGSETHPNSQPVHKVSLAAFRIGLYPVVNRDYTAFIADTKRKWQSPDGGSAEMQNAPATDLSWYDARAYCAWLTPRWRACGKITGNEHVRLPTEPEWERAARLDISTTDAATIIYPWGTAWRDDAANYEVSGLNARCAVGLFPKGRAASGCYDMVGQVWEWCSTLWGEEMTTPTFRYPWREDGREDAAAPGEVRRVLRGGCFSSGREKISCAYRGSLEAGGSWRGNGFRVVVAPVPA